MSRLSIPRLSSLRLQNRALPLLFGARITTRQYSSGSPTKTNLPADHFTKTGEKPQDPRDQVSRSYEYSQSGGDDMVAQQSGAAFGAETSPTNSKSTAAKGNKVNPLEFSPAEEELSRPLSEAHTSRGEERKEGEVSGQSSGRKGKKVPKSEIDFR